MATYGVYSTDLKGCYISGLDMINARRYLQGGAVDYAKNAACGRNGYCAGC